MKKEELKQNKKLSNRRNNKKHRRNSSNHHHVNQEVKDLQEVLRVVQVVEVKVELPRVDQKVLQEVKKLQEVLQEVDQEEEPLREEQELTGEDQGEGAISGVSLISQYLQT